MTYRKFAVPALASAAVLLTSAFATAGTVQFPGFPWESSPPTASVIDGAASAQGATLRVTAVYGDPVQTTIAYSLDGLGSESSSGSIVPGTRLVLEDGAIVPLRWNATDPGRPGVGTMIFPALPAGNSTITLEVDGLTFASRAVSARFSIPIRVDNRQAYADSRSSEAVISGGPAGPPVTITSIIRTPAAVVVRGTFDGLSAGAIQAIGRPQVWLIDSAGNRELTDNGRLGFGEGYRQFEFHFPPAIAGSAQLEFGDLAVKGASPPLLAIAIP